MFHLGEPSQNPPRTGRHTRTQRFFDPEYDHRKKKRRILSIRSPIAIKIEVPNKPTRKTITDMASAMDTNSSTEAAASILTGDQVLGLVGGAMTDAFKSFSMYSWNLTCSLRQNVREMRVDVEEGKHVPQYILQFYIDRERDLINGWNMGVLHRGQHTPGLDDVPDSIWNFPLQRAVTAAGFSFVEPLPLESNVVQEAGYPFGVQAPVLLYPQLEFPNWAADELGTTNWTMEDYDFALGIDANQNQPGFAALGDNQNRPYDGSLTQPYNNIIDAHPNQTIDNGGIPMANATSAPPALVAQQPDAAPAMPDLSVQTANQDGINPKKKHKKQVYHPSMDVLKYAPSCNIAFPTAGNHPANITAVEVLTYLPGWLRSIDVIERFASNGATIALFKSIVDVHRAISNPTYANFWHKVTSSRMRALGDQRANGGQDYRKWIVGKHVPRPNHDHTSLDVAGFRTCAQHEPMKKIQRENDWSTVIPFRNLANGVKQHPQGYDALNLTRCVEYAVAHPMEQWMFPEHFEQLVEYLSAGPDFGVAITDHHYDAQSFTRWAEGLRISPNSSLKRKQIVATLDKNHSNDEQQPQKRART